MSNHSHGGATATRSARRDTAIVALLTSPIFGLPALAVLVLEVTPAVKWSAIVFSVAVALLHVVIYYTRHPANGGW